jgi:pyrroloquinoline quinone biosynthesis protein D
MNPRAIAGASSLPRLAAHRRLRFDEARRSWTIQAPERAFLLDDPAYAIVSRCDGATTLAAIADALSLAYAEAPRDAIFADVLTLVQDFADKGVMTL